jgi:hypothetical protein
MLKPNQQPSRSRRGEVRQAFLPGDADLENRRKALRRPARAAQDALQLLEQARIVAKSERITVDEAMGVLRSFLRERQSAELLRAIERQQTGAPLSPTVRASAGTACGSRAAATGHSIKSGS